MKQLVNILQEIQVRGSVNEKMILDLWNKILSTKDSLKWSEKMWDKFYNTEFATDWNSDKYQDNTNVEEFIQTSPIEKFHIYYKNLIELYKLVKNDQ